MKKFSSIFSILALVVAVVGATIAILAYLNRSFGHCSVCCDDDYDYDFDDDDFDELTEEEKPGISDEESDM